MAVFEVDPTPWLPWGHQVIDGGGTRLPRTFYNLSSEPPQQERDLCIAIVEPAPPAMHEGLWRDRVRDFLVNQLNRQVLDYQPSPFGFGLYQLCSPNSRDALVQHALFHIGNNRLVRFINPDEAPENSRSVQGYRKGWLMFLGIPPDYRNDYDIANAVSTFGKFHSWTSNDPIKCSALVYASFPSPALVPRDIVFGKYSSIGGVRKSWTVALYILTADFADELPADEDQMPPDGNPHPLPGHILQNLNMFVLPQYPEIGWDAVQQPELPLQHSNPMQDDQVMDEQVHMQESMILNPSQNSESSINLQISQDHVQVLQVGFALTHVYSPVLPPVMQWRKVFDSLPPMLMTQEISSMPSLSPFQWMMYNAPSAIFPNA
jgi:hypothetical protein